MCAVVDTLDRGAQGTDAPYLLALVVLLLLASFAAYADGVVQADSSNFTLDTTGTPPGVGGATSGTSGNFTLDTTGTPPGIGGIASADSADFTLNTMAPVTLTLAINGGGSATKSPDQATYPFYSTAMITAQPLLGFVFSSWSGDAAGAGNPLNLLMTNNRVVTANFTSTIADLIVDNVNATFTGSWSTDSGILGNDFYASNFRYATTVSSSSGTATFRPTVALTGNYDVYVWYPDFFAGPLGPFPCEAAQYFVSGSVSNNTVSIDQATAGGSWRKIATARKFDQGTNGFVRLSNQSTDTGARVLADAVRWVWSTNQTSLAVAPLYITGITRGPTSATVTWQSISNEIYRLEYKTNLTDAVWLNVSGDVTATTNTASKTDSSLGSAARRFYRVERLP